MTTTNDLLKARFAELCAQRDATLAVAGPLRAQRDSVTQAAETSLAASLAPINAQIAAAEDGLPALMNEIAQIANALGGMTA